MNIDNELWATEDELHVCVPVRPYELTLRHRLLGQLGGFSHLVMDALVDLPARGLSWVQEVTGLSSQQLQPILNRLNGLGILRGQQLSKQGERLVLWKKLLHGQTRHVWLDGDYKSHSFVGDASLGVIELKEGHAFIVRRWHRGDAKPRDWPCADWNEDCERQKGRMLRCPEKYLSAVFDTFRDCFIETGFSAHEWDLSIRYIHSGGARSAVMVKLDQSDLLPGLDHQFTLASPMLCLDTCYSLPVGAPAFLEYLKPEDQVCAISFGVDALGGGHLSVPRSGLWQWPDVSETELANAAIALFQKTALRAASESEASFNREHILTNRWKTFGFEWAAVQNRLRHRSGLHEIMDDI